VETEAQSALLLEMGVLFGQGYLFSKAISMEALIQMARRKGAFCADGTLKSPMPVRA